MRSDFEFQAISSGDAAGRASADPADVRPRLECIDLTVRFGGVVAVDNVSLTIPGDPIVGLVGPNGAGKSTLFGAISGLLRCSSGRILLDGQDITRARPQTRAALGLARTFQQPELFSGITVREHLVIAHRAKHAKRRVWSDAFTMGSLHPPTRDEQETVDELEDLLGLGPIANSSVAGLPLGVARLVELGRALASSPTVLLLDEPTSGLDSSETAEFEHVLRKVVSERGISVLLVEHDVDLVMRMCSIVNVLDFGALLASGPPEEIRANPAVRAAYLGEETAELSVASEGIGQGEGPAIRVTQRLFSSSSKSNAGRAGERSATGPLLAVDGISVRYGDAAALSQVSFTLEQGEALAVLGANGAGKSSLARALSGLVTPYAGRVRLDGDDITSRPAHAIRRSGVVHLPEGRGVFRGLSVVENLRMAAGLEASRRSRSQAVDLALELFPQLAARRRQRAGLLSGGEQQMLSLARALAISPKLIIADEMSLGLAPLLVDAVFEGLSQARSAGIAVIIIEQYVRRAVGFADECLVLQRGAVAWRGPADAAGGAVVRHYLGDAMATTT